MHKEMKVGRSFVSKERIKNSQEQDITGTANPNRPKGYTITYNVMLRSKN